LNSRIILFGSFSGFMKYIEAIKVVKGNRGFYFISFCAIAARVTWLSQKDQK